MDGMARAVLVWMARTFSLAGLLRYAPSILDSFFEGRALTLHSREVGGTDNGVYRIQLAMLEFDDVPANSAHDSSATAGTATSSVTPTVTSTNSNKHPNYPVSSIISIVEHGTAANIALAFVHGYAIYLWVMNVVHFTRIRPRII